MVDGKPRRHCGEGQAGRNVPRIGAKRFRKDSADACGIACVQEKGRIGERTVPENVQSLPGKELRAFQPRKKPAAHQLAGKLQPAQGGKNRGPGKTGQLPVAKRTGYQTITSPQDPREEDRLVEFVSLVELHRRHAERKPPAGHGAAGFPSFPYRHGQSGSRVSEGSVDDGPMPPAGQKPPYRVEGVRADPAAPGVIPERLGKLADAETRAFLEGPEILHARLRIEQASPHGIKDQAQFLGKA